MSNAQTASMPGFKTVFRANGLSPLHMLQMVAFAFFAAGLGLAWHLAQAPHQALTAPRDAPVDGLSPTAGAGR